MVLNGNQNILAFSLALAEIRNAEVQTGKNHETSESRIPGRAKLLRKMPEGKRAIDEVINKIVKTGSV